MKIITVSIAIAVMHLVSPESSSAQVTPEDHAEGWPGYAQPKAALDMPVEDVQGIDERESNPPSLNLSIEPEINQLPPVSEEQVKEISQVPRQEAKWFKCQKQSDCSIVKDTCERQVAINRSYEMEYSAWRDKSVGKTDCMVSTFNQQMLQERPTIADCRIDQCIVTQELDSDTAKGESPEDR